VDEVLGQNEPAPPPPEKALVGEVIGLDELWACTNCMYCMENCSASIEHVPKIVGMRQYKVLMEADFALSSSLPTGIWKTTPILGVWVPISGVIGRRTWA